MPSIHHGLQCLNAMWLVFRDLGNTTSPSIFSCIFLFCVWSRLGYWQLDLVKFRWFHNTFLHIDKFFGWVKCRSMFSAWPRLVTAAWLQLPGCPWPRTCSASPPRWRPHTPRRTPPPAPRPRRGWWPSARPSPWRWSWRRTRRGTDTSGRTTSRSWWTNHMTRRSRPSVLTSGIQASS